MGQKMKNIEYMVGLVNRDLFGQFFMACTFRAQFLLLLISRAVRDPLDGIMPVEARRNRWK